ncbi:MAG TPA: hypothetical protein VES20_16330 [Bryobacteraceae bacterium]|nr:hypothetical protein [Bryobacteraceae bacterium]
MKILIISAIASAVSLIAQTGTQTVSGVLLDAGCPALASGATGSEDSSMPRKTTAGPSHASATGTTGAATETAVSTRSAEGVARAEANEVTHAGRQTATSGLNNQPGVGSSSGATTASAAGTTGSAPAPVAGTTPGTGPVAPQSAGRGRSADAAAERYADCGAKSSTTAFAIHSSDGTIYRLDDAGNAMVRRQAGKGGFDGKVEVSAVGSTRGDRFSIKSVQRSRASHP